MNKRALFLAVAIGLLLLGTTAALADDIIYDDPATLHIGPGIGTPCQTGCGFDPNPVPTTHVDIFQNSGGAPNIPATSANPVLMILGIPGDASSRFGATPPIASASFYNPYTSGSPLPATAVWATNSTGNYGMTGLSNGFKGGFNSGSPEVYTFLGLGGVGNANSSNNYGNWAGAEKSPVPGNTFGIYVIALYLTGSNAADNVLGPNGEIDVTFSSPLPAGTYIVGYGFDCTTHNSAGACTAAKVFSTPFTEAGQTTNVPEPGSMALLGTGLFALAGIVRRRALR